MKMIRDQLRKLCRFQALLHLREQNEDSFHE